MLWLVGMMQGLYTDSALGDSLLPDGMFTQVWCRESERWKLGKGVGVNLLNTAYA